MEDITFRIIAEGEIATNEIEQVQNATERLGNTTNTQTINMSKAWRVLGASIAVVVANMTIAIKEGIKYEQQTFLLTDSQKELEKELNIVGEGFVQTALSAGLSIEKTKEMINIAKALGRAYPNESTEEFVNNLVMLNTTGEAQGYIVDILEQKLGNVDLATVSLADKMQILNDVTGGVNDRFNQLASSRIAEMGRKIADTYKVVGERFLQVFKNLGWINTAEGWVDSFTESVSISKDNIAFWGIAIEDIGGRVINIFNLMLSPIYKAIDGFKELGIVGQMALNKIKIKYEELTIASMSKMPDIITGNTVRMHQKRLDTLLAQQEKHRQNIKSINNKTNNDIKESWKKATTPINKTIGDKYKKYLDESVKSTKKATKSIKGIQANWGKDYGDLKTKYKKVETNKADTKEAREKERLAKQLAKKIIDINKKIEDDYLKSTMTKFDYERYKLGSLYAERVKYAKNTNKLNVWLSEELKKINGKEIDDKARVENEKLAIINSIKQQELERNKEITKETTKYQKQIADGMTDYIMEVTETGKVSFASFANMAISLMNDVLKSIMKAYIQKQMLAGVQASGGSGLLGNLLGAGITAYAGGSYSSAPHPTTPMPNGATYTPFASGGIVGTPTAFDTNIGLTGEDGEEGILPLKRARNGDLGVTVSGSNSGGDTKVIENKAEVYFTVTAMDSSSFQSSLMENQALIENIIANSLGTNGTVRSSL